MSETGCNSKNYLVTLAIGAIAGGITVAWATKALPKMMPADDAQHDDKNGL